MPITESNIKFYRAALTSDVTPAQNGGRLSATAVASGVKNNLFPDVPQSQRTAGATVLRKAFLKVETTANTELIAPNLFVMKASEGDDYYLLRPGTQTGTQDALTSRRYGLGTLAAATALGATTLTVTLEHAGAAALSPFQAGDPIIVTNRNTVTEAGDAEYLTAAAVAVSGGTVTLTLAGGTGRAWAAGDRVASVWQPGNLKAAVSAITPTSAAGTVTGAAIGVANTAGVVQQTWTLTFTSGSSFRLDGDSLGANLATGTTGADFTPANTAFAAPYFTLPSTAWGGVWATGDKLVFTTAPSAIAFWLERIVPAGAASLTSTAAYVGLDAESAA